MIVQYSDRFNYSNKSQENYEEHQMYWSKSIPRQLTHKVKFFDYISTLDDRVPDFQFQNSLNGIHSQYQDGKFTDPEFPPCDKSIGVDLTSGLDKARDPLFFSSNRYVWRRAESLYKQINISLIDQIDPRDVNQGSLGDCQILANFGCVAKYPDIVRSMFRTKKINREGKYVLRLFRNGMPCYITIDSQIPVDEFTNKPYGITSKTGHLWPIFLEKAYAKMKGSYNQLSSGECHHAFQDFTGNPSYQLENPHNIINNWDLLSNIIGTEKHLMTAAIDSRIRGHERGKVNRFGLLTDHAYSVLGAKEQKGDKNSYPIRLVLLRNPQGKREYNGDWSDYSSRQTPELVKYFGLKRDPLDGKFQMSHDEFMNKFDTYSACDCSKPQKANRVSTFFELNDNAKSVKSPAYRFEVPANSHTNQITIHQQDPRTIGSKPVLDIGALILKEPNLECVASIDSQLDRQAQKKVDLPPGSYQIHTYSSGAHFQHGSAKNDRIRTAAITLHSYPQAPSKLEQIMVKPGEIDGAFTTLLDKFYRQPSPSQSLSTHQMEVPYKFIMGNLGALIVAGVENNKNCDKQVCLKMDPSHSKNLIPAVDSWQGLEPKTMYLPPGNKGLGMVILGKYVRQNEEASRFGCQVKFKYLDSPPTNLSDTLSYNSSVKHGDIEKSYINLTNKVDALSPQFTIKF